LAPDAPGRDDTEDQYAYENWSHLLRILTPVLHFGVLGPLAMLGVCMTWTQRRQVWVLYLLAVSYAASVACFYVFARYRFPLVSVLVLFAAAGLVELVALWRAKQFAKLAGCAVIGAAIAVPLNWRLIPEDHIRATTHSNLGVSLAKLPGRMEEARAQYEQALQLKPEVSRSSIQSWPFFSHRAGTPPKRSRTIAPP
jgi:hypothetical protein